MKILNFFVVALATLTVFASCSKEENGPNDGNGNKASVRFTIQGTAETKALGAAAFDPTGLGVDAYDVTVFIISSTDAVIAKKYYLATELTSNTTEEILTTTDAKYAIVVANTGTTTKFDGVTTLAALKSVIFTLNEAVVLTAAGTVTNNDNRILLQGQSADFNWTTAGASATDPAISLVEAEVTLFPVPARLNVEVLNRMTASGTATWADGYVNIERVSVLYSANNTFAVPTISGSDPAPYKNYSYVVPIGAAYTPYYVSGFDPNDQIGGVDDGWDMLQDATPTDQNAYATGASLTYLNRTWTTAGPGTGTSFVAANDFQGTFYALPGAGAHGAYATISIVGTYDADGSSGPGDPVRYFWHIRMTESDAGYILKNGHQYDVKIKLSGDITNGAGGSPDPDEEVVPGYVTVEITTAGWPAAITINKEIQ